jgi:GNAT superfamily N-acetyltransferase
MARYTKLWDRSPWFEGDEAGRAAWKKDWEEFGTFAIEDVASHSPYEAAVVLAPAEGHRRRITFLVEEDAPHRIRVERWERVFDFDLQIRDATPDDADTLRDIERGSLVILGDTAVATDRGPDYFAAARLMPEVTVFLAEIEGEPAGVAWGAVAPVKFLGEQQNASYFIHLRILPNHQRKGLWGALDNALWAKYWETTDVYVGYYMIENVAWSHVAQQVQSQPDFVARDWVPTVYRLLLPTAPAATAPTGVRTATPADAATIVEILNAFHEGEEFYLPYTEESLTARLERDPLYSWDHVVLADGAVLGVWPAGDKIEMVTTRAGETTVSKRGHVMDYGFLPGAEDNFRDLIGSWSTELDGRGISQLSLFTSKGARGQPVLKELKATVEAYRFNTGTAARIPDDAQKTGIYTDHLFF